MVLLWSPVPKMVVLSPHQQQHHRNWRKCLRRFARKVRKQSKRINKLLNCSSSSGVSKPSHRTHPTFTSTSVQADMSIVDQLRHRGETMAHRKPSLLTTSSNKSSQSQSTSFSANSAHGGTLLATCMHVDHPY